MILSKSLYLKNNAFRRGVLGLRQVMVSFARLFKGASHKVDGHTKLIGLPELDLALFAKANAQECERCVALCPTQALEYKAASAGQPAQLNLHVLRCISCALCVQASTSGMLRMGSQMARANDAQSEWIISLSQVEQQVASE